MGRSGTKFMEMLAEFVMENRDSIIRRTRARVAKRTSPMPSEKELTNGIPLFLDQLVVALRVAERNGTVDHRAIDATSAAHGQDLLRLGLTIGQTVHAYGDVCQAITEMAIAEETRISPREFQTLNLCLDEAIAGAVSAYSKQRERNLADEGTQHLGVLAHELRGVLSTATLSFQSMQSGRVAATGSTALIHERSLRRLSDLIDRSLSEVRLQAGIDRQERIFVAEFLEEVEIAGLLQARARKLHFAVTSVDPEVTIQGDRQILTAAVSNLLHNAFKFTRQLGHVGLTTRVTRDRVVFDVEDECGGLPAGKTEELFRPFEQRSADRTGLGLGLSICRKAAAASGGEIRVQDRPGRGCVFSLDLPRVPPVAP